MAIVKRNGLSRPLTYAEMDANLDALAAAAAAAATAQSAANAAAQFSYDANGNPMGLAGPGGSVLAWNKSGALSNWFVSGIAGKKIAWVGDSTTMQLSPTANGGTAGVNSYYVNTYVAQQGSPLYGTSNVYFGANGNTLANFVQNTPAGYGVSDVIAAKPDLIVFSYGINDVRQGLTTQAQLVSLLQQAVNAIRAALPKCDIVLRMPNSLLTTDVNGYGYVVPAGPAAGQTVAQAAQTYTDILRNAYLSLENYWPNVVVYKSQIVRFPSTSPASSPYMNDQLHPTVAGYSGIFDDIAGIIGYSPAYSIGASVAAQAANYVNAHLTYPRVVENGDYTLITSGAWVGQGSGYLDFSGDQSQMPIIAQGDIVVQNGQAAFTLPAGVAASASGANIRLTGIGAGVPSYAQIGGVVSIYRHKYAGTTAAKAYLNNKAYQTQRVRIVSAGNGWVRLDVMPADSGWTFRTTQTLLYPGLGAVSLASATFSMSGSAVQINVAGTDFTTTALQCLVAAPVAANSVSYA